MFALALFVVSVAAVDSVNPSTIAPALYLASEAGGSLRVAGFTAGVFSVSTAAGLVLTFGPGQAVLALVPRPGRHVTHLIELGLGGVVLGVAVVLWLMRTRVARKVFRDDERVRQSSLLLGAGIAAVELPTALPYFAVMAAIVAGDENVVSRIALILLFDGVFVAPLLIIFALRRFTSQGGLDALSWLRRQLDQRAALIIPAAAVVAATALLLLGTIGIATD